MATASVQRFKPPQSSSITSSSDNRPTVVLCSSKDDHLLSQDICILCGSLGKDDEGNLISCSQCGQCYHPYCVNIKGLKVVVSKGWRCLDCTVCETCGQPGDEGKLLLCDECELSYHTYCLNPPLEDVPPDAWKCHWCVVCQKCKSHAPGVNSEWQKNYTECGPCASQTTCPKCHVNYTTGDLILQCTNCSRWLHAECDSIYDEDECALAKELGYSCLLCRPEDETPPFMLNRKAVNKNQNRRENESASHDIVKGDVGSKIKSASEYLYDDQLNRSPRPQSAPLATSAEINNHQIKRPASSLHFSQNDNKSDLNDESNLNDSNIDDSANRKTSTDPMIDLVHGSRMVDGVYLSETGLSYIKSQKVEPTKRQRAKRGTKMQKLDDCGIEEANKDDDEENKLTTDKIDEDGRKKRVRKLSKAGIGGFTVRQRGVRGVHKDDEFGYNLNNDNFETSTPTPPQQLQQFTKDQSNDRSIMVNGKPKRVRKKPKKKTNISDQYPSYLQEAFFGKTLLTDEKKAADDKANELNDCSNLDLDSREAQRTSIVDSTQSKGGSKFGDFQNVAPKGVESRFGMDTEGDIMDVFLNDSRATDDSSENNQDILNINLDLVDPLDSSVVEDVLNGLGNTQQPTLNHPMSDSNVAAIPPSMMSPSIRSMPEPSMHFDQSPHMMPSQTPSPRMQFSRPQLQPHTMLQVSKVRPPMLDPTRMQPSDPYSMPPHTPRPGPMPQRSPFSPQSPYQPHQMNASSSTPPINPRTPVEQAPLYHSTNQPIIPGHVQPQPQYVENHPATHVQQPPMQYQQQIRSQQPSQPHFSNQPPPPPQPPRMEPPKQNPTQDWEAEEALGTRATKSAVLYTNTEHPNLKLEFRSPEERFKQIQKLWRQLPADKRKPYVEKARENRSASKVSAKPSNDTTVGAKKPESPLVHQPKPQMMQEGTTMQPQQMHMVQQPMVNQSQDTRWRQPMPIDNSGTRFAQSPHQASHHMMHDPTMMQPLSPTVRPLVDPHFDANSHQMIPPQTPSPQMQYSRPPNQQHPMIQVSRVRPPMMDMNRGQPVDPYSIPPSTPRPVSVPQRSPYSPQSPFPPHPSVNASSTPPVTPRTPNEHVQMYQNNSSQNHQQTFVEPHAAQMQQPAQYQQIRQPQYPNQQRLAGPAPVMQYGNQMSSGQAVVNRPIGQQVRPQMASQQAMYQQQQAPPQQSQQQQAYRQPVRYVNPHQDPHQLTGSPLQQNQSPQLVHQQRMQRPQMANQIPQPMGAQRMMHSRPSQQINQGVHMSAQHMPVSQQISHPQSAQQHQMQSQPIQQQPVHQQVQHQVQMNMQPVPTQQVQYSNVQMSSRIDAEDSLPLLDDEDALRDLGADFNILEFADPEHEKGASTSSGGKNNIDLDPELEDIFDQDQLEEKRANEQLVTAASTASQPSLQQSQHQQQQGQQMMYQPLQSQVQQHMPANQSFIEGQHHQVGMQNSVVTQNQYSSQRQPQFANQQQRVMAPSNQHANVQPQMVRQQMMNNQVRMQHPQQHPQQQQQQLQQQQQQQQQMSYAPSRPQQALRYQSSVVHEMHTSQTIQQTHIIHQSQPSNQVQMQRGSHQMQSQQHYNNNTNFVDSHQQPQPMQTPQMHHHHQHHHQSQQQMQYSQGPQQTMVYSNHQHGQQINQPRRQFQAISQQQQPVVQHQNYGYQQPQQQQMIHQQNYQQMPNQQMSRGSNDVMMHDKNPIIGEPITSIEFSMYEAGSGADNQAANFFDFCDVPTDPDQEQQRVNMDAPDNEQLLIPESSAQLSHPIENPAISRDQDTLIDNLVEIATPQSVPETGSKYMSSNSGRMSSCSNPQDLEAFCSKTSNGDKNNLLGQNQLLKQLLATCPAADGPNPEVAILSPKAETAKVSMSATNQNIAKQPASGVPTISFQMDCASEPAATANVSPQTQSGALAQVRTTTTIGTSFQSRPSITSTGVAPSSNFEIKTYNVGQQVLNSGPSQPGPLVRVPQMTASNSQTPISHDFDKPQLQESSNRPSTDSNSDIGDMHSNQPSVSGITSPDASKASSDAATSAQLKAAAKISAAKQRKSDYMAKRRADLEKEPTPPPREIKPKKRVRGPNKRSRAQLDSDEVKTNDSNSNTSDTNQLVANGTPSSAPPRKRVRKSQKAKAENETTLSSFASKLNIDLPSVTVNEPLVEANMNVGSMFSSGDLNLKSSKLRGQFGRGVPITNTLVEHSHNKGRRKIIGYYHEEFPKELADIPTDHLAGCLFPSTLERDCDSPSSIISASSSEYDEGEFNASENYQDDEITGFIKLYTPDLNRFKSSRKILASATGGQLLDTDASNTDINNNSRSLSPSIPIDIRLPITQVRSEVLDQDPCENNKENCIEAATSPIVKESPSAISQPNTDQSGTSLNMRLKDHGNVSVSLTLTSEEVDGVKRVLSKMPDLIENAEPTVGFDDEATAVELHDSKINLNGSVRLVTGASDNQADQTVLKFNETNYVPMDVDAGNAAFNCTDSESVDVKPEICRHCKTVVMNRGIRKSINEIPEHVKSSLKGSSAIGLDQNEELVYCSVDCYATSLMRKPLSKLNALELKPSLEEGAIDPNKTENIKKKWYGVSYVRWSPTFFEPNKTTASPTRYDVREAVIMDNSTFTPSSSSQLINQGDSSVDSNESDNSTSYSLSMSGKLGNSMDSPSNNQEIVSSYLPTREAKPRPSDIIPPWPGGLDLIQVRPYKPISSEKIACEHSSETSEKIVEIYVDSRKCVLCHEFGDGETDGPARLLNFFIDGWVHLNCALWSLDVYELANGALMNVELACRKAMTCSLCRKSGATLKCFKPRCPNYYHFVCALKEKCSFYEDKSVQCRQHTKTSVKEMTSFIVKRRVYINRDEQTQVAEMIQSEQQNVMRIGSLVFLNIGQLLPHQLGSFHDKSNIFPVGFKVIRYYWSYRQFNKRCKYICTVEDNEGRPRFRIVAQEFRYADEEFSGDSPQEVWDPIIDKIIRLRENVPDTITTFRAYIRGVDLFGLTEPSIVRILESLPGVETLTDYEFKYGRSPLLELPLAINPTGCARTEPKLRTHFKRPYTIHTANNVTAKSRLQSLNSSDLSSPYVKQFVHSKSSQYRKMKSEWRNNVVLARSSVQGLGLYAARDIEKHTMVIEYIGMLIRNEIAERYERIHEANNRGIYMFRLDEDRVIDATLAGGLARYINHSCNPNCVAEAVEIDRERKILIIANRKILKGEELGYDYKLAIEDDQHKISCLCGAPTCKKWMN